MNYRVRISTSIHKSVTDAQRASPCFVSLLTFPYQMYAAQMRPRRRDDVDPRNIREQYLYQGYERFDGMTSAFQQAGRIEMRIIPPPWKGALPKECGPGDWICAELDFISRHRDPICSLGFSFNLGTGFLTGMNPIPG